ncbi:MAG: 4Fe-4S binding protein, partial [Defluviitaleaceae bacterium]|nr:4Fe-4S binding protein [Defluviitaleaceae bacterium]
MTNNSIYPVDTNSDLCTGCNRCVRECPMETANITYQDEAGNIKVKIDHDKCIACGWCVSSCKHEARRFRDDTERFFDDLKNGANISVIAAPAIRTNIPEYENLFTFLKQQGVKKIFDVSLGADICVWAHIRHLENTGFAPIITQPCPVIVMYCEKYRHDLLKWLSPVQSPMACASVYMKQYIGIEDQIAALSPCIAKTNEFAETNLAQYNITFTGLLEYIKNNGITLPEIKTAFDHGNSGLGSLFPMPGGLKENLEYFTGRKLHISKSEGSGVYEKLDAYAQTDEASLPTVFDVLNCEEGCNIGSASLRKKNFFEIEKIMHDARKKVGEERDKRTGTVLYPKYDETLSLSHFMREYRPKDIPFAEITDEDIEKAFAVLGKHDQKKQNVDCSACGSETCHHMARKIALNVNIPVNCIVKAMEDAKAEHEENIAAHKQLVEMERIHEVDERTRIMLDATPLGAHFWDENFNIVDCNLASVNLFKMSSKKEYMEKYF